MSAPVLRTALKTYPHTAGIKNGTITDPRVTLDCVEIDPIYKAFAPMAQAWDDGMGLLDRAVQP